jgi:uncharacterized protein (DUF2062 family)
VGISLALGVFIGCQPLYGLHLVLCLLVCVPLKLDAVVAYLGANISNPLFAPLLVTLELEVGSLLLTGEHVTRSFDADPATLASSLVLQVVTGSLVVGVVLGVLLGALAFAVLSAFERAQVPGALAIKKVTSRYRTAPIKDRIYVGFKLRTDPLAAELGRLGGPFGDVLDLGSGRGQFALLLDELDNTVSLCGIDWDERRVLVARCAARDGQTFVVGDVSEAELSSFDTVLLFDVLHYLPREQQLALLRKAAGAVRPGGRLLVRELDAASALSGVGRSSERVAAGTGYNRARELSFVSQDELASQLREFGFSCELHSTRRAPFFLPNVFLVATRR